MKKRILILGGSFSYVGSILAAKEMGCEVLVADRNTSAIDFKLSEIAMI